MPTLRDIQRDLARSILCRDDSVALAHVADDGAGALERLNIYRNNVAMTLVGALRVAYPAVEGLVGPAFFDATAQAFIARHPPRTACLDDFGSEFPGFLGGFPAAAGLAYLEDVARLEWTVNVVLHAPDAPVLLPDALTVVAARKHGRVAFVPHPAVGLVAVHYPADAIWRAVVHGDEATLGAIAMTVEPRWLMVQRLPSGVAVVRLDDDEASWTELLFSGGVLDEIMPEDGNVRFAALLAEHLAGGRFAGFVLNHGTTSGEDV